MVNYYFVIYKTENIITNNIKSHIKRKENYMNNIITTETRETITSMEVAQMVNKDHSQLLKDIRRYIKQIGKSNEVKSDLVNKINFTDFFEESSYIDAKGESRTCYDVTRKGCEFIANKLIGQKGTEFTARYVNKFHELEEGNVTNSFITALNSISESMQIMKNEVNDRLTNLEELTQKKKPPEKKYSRWKTNTFNKLHKLQEYVNENSDEQLTLPNIIHLVIGETEDTYSIEINDYVDLYKSELNLEETPYAVDVINHYKDIRDMFTLTLDSIMNRLHIQENRECNKRNVFDVLAERLEKEN